MQEKLGVYFVNTHDKQENWDYIKQMNPIAIRVMDASVSLIKRVYDVLPNALIFPRYWSISEDQERYKTDPVGLANDHIAFWRNKIGEFEAAGMDRNRFVTVSQNEPTIWADADRNADYTAWFNQMKTVYKYNLDYNLTLANGLGNAGIRTCLLNFSVGHPANLKDGQKSFWNWAAPLVEVSRRFRHPWVIHEYWPKDGPQNGWEWLAGRWQHIPYDVEIVIGECGIDRYVNEPNVPQHQRGWKSVVSARDYAIQLNSYAAHLELDSRVLVAFPFLTDYADNRWQSFDTFDARFEIVKEKSVPYATYLPVVTNWSPEPEKPQPPVEDVLFKLHWPPTGQVSQEFYTEHTGVDIALSEGTPLYSLYDGEVAYVGFEESGYGLYLRVYHPIIGCHSFYAHCSNIIVKPGDKVSTGQLLGYSGNSGNSTGPHLHFEIRLAEETGQYKRINQSEKGQIDPIGFLHSMSGLVLNNKPIGHF